MGSDYDEFISRANDSAIENAYLFRKSAFRVPSFEVRIQNFPDDCIMKFLKKCIDNEWTEGTLLCEREIARRGLHITDNERRFEL